MREEFDYNLEVFKGKQEIVAVSEAHILRGEAFEIYDIAMSFMDFAKNYGYDITKSASKMETFLHSYYVGAKRDEFKKTIVENYDKICEYVCDELRIILLEQGCILK